MINTYNINFYCRKQKANKKGLAPVEVSILINGERVFIQLPRKEYPDDFKKAIETKRNNPTKDYCEQVRMQFNNIQLDMMQNNIPLNSNNLKEYFRTGGIKRFTIEDAFAEYEGLLKKRVGINLTYPAFKKYQDAFRCFFKHVDKTKELTFITPSVIEHFLAEINQTYQAATVNGIMTKIKTVINYQRDNNRLKINPFLNVKYSKGKKDIVFLTEDELDKLYNLYIENKSLSDVRDAFILQASCGLAYVDIAALTKEDIQIDEDGTHYIVKNRRKTSTQFTTVVLNRGVEVLKKHNYQLHIISNQKYNTYLKIIQKLAGIETTLTTHLARKTFGTLLLNKGVRLEVVSKSLGHANTQITQSTYAKLINKTVIDELKKIL